MASTTNALLRSTRYEVLHSTQVHPPTTRPLTWMSCTAPDDDVMSRDRARDSTGLLIEVLLSSGGRPAPEACVGDVGSEVRGMLEEVRRPVGEARPPGGGLPADAAALAPPAPPPPVLLDTPPSSLISIGTVLGSLASSWRPFSLMARLRMAPVGGTTIGPQM